MNKLDIFVCENFSPEFMKVTKDEGFDDVNIIAYPCMCENKSKKSKALELLSDTKSRNDNVFVISSKHCDILKLLPENSSIETRSSLYCFRHLSSEPLISYIIKNGGYIVGSGWLSDWERHIESMGFNRETAMLFYKDFCKELIFFDTGTANNAEEKLKELSNFLDLPYEIIPIGLDYVAYLLKSIVYEWKLRKDIKEHTDSINKIQLKCAEYSAVFDLIGKIASFTTLRETIDKTKEIFTLLFGAQKFLYTGIVNIDDGAINNAYKIFIASDKTYLLNDNENYFYVKIFIKDKVCGVIEAGDFIFPQNITQYLNFAIEISKVCGLALSNIEQYERIVNSEKKFEYLSFHDSLTGLYNRAYVNKIIEEGPSCSNICIFAFDIDGLKYVNDNYGHLEGDKLIVSSAEIFKKSFREDDMVARIGGDEFIAIVYNCDHIKAELIKSRIEDAIEFQNKNIHDSNFKVSISIGYSLSHKDDDTIVTLIHNADTEMYTNKTEKRKSIKL